MRSFYRASLCRYWHESRIFSAFRCCCRLSCYCCCFSHAEFRAFRRHRCLNDEPFIQQIDSIEIWIVFAFFTCLTHILYSNPVVTIAPQPSICWFTIQFSYINTINYYYIIIMLADTLSLLSIWTEWRIARFWHCASIFLEHDCIQPKVLCKYWDA